MDSPEQVARRGFGLRRSRWSVFTQSRLDPAWFGGGARAPPERMRDRVSDLIPFLHVRHMEASIGFYEQLGLEVDDTDEQDGRVVWASMRSGSAALMLAEAPPPIEPSGGRHFLYTAGLAALRERLIEAGWEPPEIEDGTPGPKREMSICDPDRHFLTIAEIED